MLAIDGNLLILCNSGIEKIYTLTCSMFFKRLRSSFCQGSHHPKPLGLTHVYVTKANYNASIGNILVRPNHVPQTLTLQTVVATTGQVSRIRNMIQKTRCCNRPA